MCISHSYSSAPGKRLVLILHYKPLPHWALQASLTSSQLPLLEPSGDEIRSCPINDIRFKKIGVHTSYF
ncbi:hypothetical protein APX70_00373 [Pseudomonas syringae pv. maculicola]|uniref:Uncharacterized protein n=1 Tax=Pseudomonas syringae pv. maculicola TaxID=59511 RepID=A0A3M2WWV3_PSEYM|nr:hypothetical protein APX70_00373 [Pseudomonas syringae pv. maculicola]